MENEETKPAERPQTGISAGGPGAAHDARRLDMGHYFLLALILLACAICYKIIQPYIHPVILASILAVVLGPVHKRLLTAVKGRANTAALLSCMFLTLVVVLPLFVVTLSVIKQGVDSFNGISEWIAAGKYRQLTTHPFVISLTDFAGRYLPDITAVFPDIDPNEFEMKAVLLKITSSVGTFLLDHGGQLFGNLSALVIKFFLMIFVFFFFIRDREKIRDYVMLLIPLRRSQEEEIFAKIDAVARSAMLGTAVTALAQGIAGGVSFWICGLPGLFWGMVMAFASFIPVVGTALVWGPATIYLLLSGQWGYGIFLVLWSVIVVGSIDNFVRPMFMQGGADMSTLLIFLAILGGINYFGLIGLLYGPLMFGLVLVLLYIYGLEFETFLAYQDRH